MNRFLKKILFFSALLLCLLVVSELFVPSNWNSFRCWERSINSSKYILGEFYPNENYTRDEVGGLAHHTQFAVEKKNVEWVSDAIGFRNRKHYKSPDVIFLGASNVVGSAVSQENILSEKVELMSGLRSNNIGSNRFKGFTQLINSKIYKNPKVLVYANIERSIPKYQKAQTKAKISKNKMLLIKYLPNWFKVALDKIKKRNTKNYIKARIKKSVGRGIQSTIDERMFFLQSTDSDIKQTKAEIDKTVEILETYDKFCKSKGMEFIFMPIPNKETIYFELVPFKSQPAYLNQLFEALKETDLKFINLLTLFNEAKKNDLLYDYDESHWNKKGIDIAAKEVVKVLKAKN